MARASVFLRRCTVSAVCATVVPVLVLGAVSVAVLNTPVASASVAQSPGLTAGKVLSGVMLRGSVAQVNAFGAWRGQPVTAVVDYIATDSWYDMTNVTGEGLTLHWTGSNAHRVWSVPLIPTDGSSSLETAATGAYNNNYAKIAQGLIAGGDGNATIRLGWEMTGNWFAWSGINDPAAYAGAFRQAVTAMRSVSGAHFTFDWNIAMGEANPAPMYPGDAYVDLIGADNYDGSYAWDYPPSAHAQVWNHIVTQTYGLNWLAAFAAQHGKRMSFPEWGVAYKCDGHGGGDDPYFIDAMHSWIASHDVAYESYFEHNDNSCSQFSLDSGLFPNAAAEYVKDWSTGTISVTNPVTPVAPVTPPVTAPVVPVAPPVAAAPPVAPVPASGLLISYSSDRSSPAALQGATVGKSAYIFYATQSPVRLVVFSLDGKPYRTETSAAYDLVGTTATGAKPFLPSKLKAGQHTISAAVTSTSGVTTTVTASFTVPASAVKTLTTRYLRVSSGVGHRTVRLDRALLRGTPYVSFPTVTGQAKATYLLDGTVVRTGKANAAGLIKVASLSLPGLPLGLHSFVLRLVSPAGHVTLVRARFRIV